MSPVGSHPLSACFWFLDEGADNSFSSFSGFGIWPCLPLRVYRQTPQPHCSLSEAFADELPSLGHIFPFPVPLHSPKHLASSLVQWLSAVGDFAPQSIDWECGWVLLASNG